MKSNYIGPEYAKNLNKKKLEKLLNKKSLPKLLAELQKVFNCFIRLRDTKYDSGKPYFVCISCGVPKGLDQMNAGHFFAVGSFPALRFDEDNVHGQCIYCNQHHHGNLRIFQVNLIKKIGQDKFNILDLRAHNRSKLMQFEVEILIEQYKKKIEELKVSRTKTTEQ